MKKISNFLRILYVIPFITVSANAADIFDAKQPVIDNLPVLEMSDVFADIFQNLDSVSWGGKDIRMAIESIEHVSKGVKIAVTDRRIVVLNKDTIIGNWPKPEKGNWKEFGEITTAIILKLREVEPSLKKMDVPQLYTTVVTSIMKEIDENGRYVYSREERGSSDPHVLTSLGIAGVRTQTGDYILNTIFKGSPADVAGLVDGDILIAANGVDLKNLSDAQILGLFNGFSSGTIKIKAIGHDRVEKSVVIRRASVIIADADIVILDVGKGKKILEVIIHRITNDSVNIVADALDKYKDSTSGIYLDLRVATGDDEIAMAKLAGLFLGQVPVARLSVVSQDDTEIVPGGDAAIPDVPVVVSVSSATKGTAEALAFAFYDNGVGATIGMPTAGKAKLITTINLKNGGELEVMNRTVKTGKGMQIDGRGFFPTVCLSTIRTSEQKGVFVANVIGQSWHDIDYNKNKAAEPKQVRKGCPNITSGADEDAVAIAVATDILVNKKVYNSVKNVSE